MLLQSSLSIDSRTDVFDTCHTAVIRNMSAILTFVAAENSVPDMMRE